MRHLRRFRQDMLTRGTGFSCDRPGRSTAWHDAPERTARPASHGAQGSRVVIRLPPVAGRGTAPGNLPMAAHGSACDPQRATVDVRADRKGVRLGNSGAGEAGQRERDLPDRAGVCPDRPRFESQVRAAKPHDSPQCQACPLQNGVWVRLFG